MIAFASSRFGPAARSNVRFQVADARSLPFREEFDLIVSLYVLHWLPEQDAALRSMPCAFRPNGLAQLRLVPDGKRKSLELVIEDTRHSAKWARYFQEFRDPYLHLTAKQYGALVARENRALANTSVPSAFRAGTKRSSMSSTARRRTES